MTAAALVGKPGWLEPADQQPNGQAICTAGSRTAVLAVNICALDRMAPQVAAHSAAGHIASSAPLTVAAAIVLVLAVPMVTWWLIGDLSTARPGNADHVIGPLVRISPGAARVLGIVALVLAIGAAAWLCWASVGNGFDLRWWSVLGPLLALGFLLGLGWRVFSAGVIGANIGAGLYAFFVGPIMLALIGWVVFRVITLLQ